VTDPERRKRVGRRRVALGLLVVLLAGACARPEVPAAASASPLAARRGRLVERLLLTGELRAARAVDIVVPRTPAWQVQLRWLEVDGSEVREGQRVFELDNTQVASDLAERRLAAERAARELERLTAELQAREAEVAFAVDEARAALAKAQGKAEVPEGLLSRRDQQERQLERARAEVALVTAEEELVAFRRGAAADLTVQRLQVEKARRDIEIAERAISELTLRAPRAGILLVADLPWEGRKLQAGDNVWVGMAIGSLPDLSSLEVDAALPDVDDGRVAVGEEARCTLDALPDLAVGCRVAEVTPVARESAGASLRRFFRVRLALAEVDVERLRPGMSVRVELTRQAAAESWLVPRVALDLAGETPLARLADGRALPVRLGACSSQECEVLEGLEEGATLLPAGGGGA
jgi:multidrug resistance efflux pump